MPAQKQKELGLVRALVVSAAAMMMVGCPGYLEEAAWLSDAGAGAYRPPAATPGAGGGALPPAALPGTGGSGVAPAPAGAGGSGAVVPPRGGSGGSGGGGGGQRDAGPAPAPDTGAAIPVPLCATAPEITSKILMPKCAR